ncbi:hypothetical protein EGH24_04190 [Halonotius terrestris]|uniref:Uncharacterized protein n=1 Tax=Halonotius terrestris TaxID=2487750 RepID=A0A8J8PA12_9EURY|nr:hypothetical protein [Halonotius terrestris]TQQ82656.1 hypothetical protein EGH24_04190 [Halonotius terrestris]
MTGPDDGSLAALAEDDPEEMIRMLARLADDDHFDVDELVGIGKECAADGVNLFRVLSDHPELTDEHLGFDIDEVRSLAETFDDAIEAAN